MATRNQYTPNEVTHPGATLSEKLQEIGMSQKEFALRTQKPEQTIIKVISAESALTPDMAVRFEDVLKIPADFWLRRQRSYDEAVARIKRNDAIAKALEWARGFPYAAMANKGWVKPTKKIEEKVAALFDFFSVAGHEAWEQYYYARQLKVEFRISLAHTPKSYSFAAWLRQGELQAKQLEVPTFNPKQFKVNLTSIKKIMAVHPDNFFEQLQQQCANAGVKLVYTPCLSGAPIHGSTRWINDIPLIQLSARYRQNDKFWFTFFHEAGHILKHGKKYISLENVTYDEKDLTKEEEANAFAIEWTFSEAQEQEVMAAAPLSEKDIVAFAKKFKTHPAMIIGRFQHRKLIPYTMGRQFLVPINLNEVTE